MCVLSFCHHFDVTHIHLHTCKRIHEGMLVFLSDWAGRKYRKRGGQNVPISPRGLRVGCGGDSHLEIP